MPTYYPPFAILAIRHSRHLQFVVLAILAMRNSPFSPNWHSPICHSPWAGCWGRARQQSPRLRKGGALQDAGGDGHRHDPCGVYRKRPCRVRLCGIFPHIRLLGVLSGQPAADRCKKMLRRRKFSHSHEPQGASPPAFPRKGQQQHCQQR